MEAQHGIDALPYYDRAPTAEERAAVRRELGKELASSSVEPSQLLAHLPDVPSLDFEDSTFLATEFRRIAAGKPSIKFSSRRVKAGPSSEADNVEGWDAALAAARAELGYEQSKMVHLQLLKKYGKEAWMAHNELVGHSKDYLERQQEETKITVNEVNLSRKREHEKAGKKLTGMEAQFWDLLVRGFAVEDALGQLRATKKAKEGAEM